MLRRTPSQNVQYIIFIIYHKTLDLLSEQIYYMPRYSGIVQSVEQRTVNPYVTGSSPVARATDSAGLSKTPRFLFLAFATYLLPRTYILIM